MDSQDPCKQCGGVAHVQFAACRSCFSEMTKAKERADLAEARARQFHDDWYAAKSEFGLTTARLRGDLREAQSDLDALRAAVRAYLDQPDGWARQPAYEALRALVPEVSP